MKTEQAYLAIVIGASAGGLYALSALLEKLPADFRLPLIVVQHRSKDHREILEEVLQSKCKVKVKQVDEKERIEDNCVYIAPPDYHLLIENDRTFSLSCDEYVRFSRPSIDVLFESAAMVYRNKLIGIILTGANNDGAAGIKTIDASGGLTIAQSPQEAQFPVMPEAAINTKGVKQIRSIAEIATFLVNIQDE